MRSANTEPLETPAGPVSFPFGAAPATRSVPTTDAKAAPAISHSRVLGYRSDAGRSRAAPTVCRSCATQANGSTQGLRVALGASLSGFTVSNPLMMTKAPSARMGGTRRGGSRLEVRLSEAHRLISAQRFFLVHRSANFPNDPSDKGASEAVRGHHDSRFMSFGEKHDESPAVAVLDAPFPSVKARRGNFTEDRIPEHESGHDDNAVVA